jgi:hypothetical protein
MASLHLAKSFFSPEKVSPSVLNLGPRVERGGVRTLKRRLGLGVGGGGDRVGAGGAGLWGCGCWIWGGAGVGWALVEACPDIGLLTNSGEVDGGS